MIVNTSEIDVTEIANSNPVHSENPMLGELMEHIRRATTKSSQNNEDDFHSLAKEFSLFEITGTKSSHLKLLNNAYIPFLQLVYKLKELFLQQVCLIPNYGRV